MTNHLKGLFAEFIAIIFLYLKGYQILETRYRNYAGEIDIICKKKKEIIFIEVKSRKYHNDFQQVLSQKQISRIKNSSFIFLKQSKYRNYNTRYDLIMIRFPFFISHTQITT